ncbi:MAG: hypothetical protein AAGF81_09170 [Pseudomonadota bacterium]
MTTMTLFGAPATAADIKTRIAIECQVTDGKGAVSYGPSRYLGELAGTLSFAQWVYHRDGVALGDQIGLYWNPSLGPKTALRATLDGPVSKPAQLVSSTDDTIVAVAFTSDQYTTRSWLITVNFPQETVMVMATSSGAAAVRGQLMILSCTFHVQRGSSVAKSAADGWRR